ncbi:nicotinamide N-methyltransferase-like [Ascaphus truei]|uniref:nicotinamide N-methyltransferase-like n=1 Tax=Ascaphus truei TaxID=8439 RepID=UPI003F59C666
MKFGRHRVRAEEQKLNPMESNHKQYHHVDIDPRIILDTYACAENNDLQDEMVEYPLKQLYKAFTSGIHFISSELFKEIIVLEPVETHHAELEMWLKKDPGSFDWSHLSKYFCDMEGKGKHQDNYRSILKNMSSLLKVKGYLLQFGSLIMSYFKLGEHTLHILTYDEEFLHQALSDTGYIIQSLDVLIIKKKSDLLDYDHLVFVVARKEREI